MPEKKPKLTFYEHAANSLAENTLNDLLGFVKFAEENQLKVDKKPVYLQGISYKKVHICTFTLTTTQMYGKPDGSWGIWPNSLFFNDYDKYVTDPELKEFILSSVNYMLHRGCDGSKCNTVPNITIFGKAFDNACSGGPIFIKNPEGKTLKQAKELVLLVKYIIDDKIACNV